MTVTEKLSTSRNWYLWEVINVSPTYECIIAYCISLYLAWWLDFEQPLATINLYQRFDAMKRISVVWGSTACLSHFQLYCLWNKLLDTEIIRGRLFLAFDILFIYSYLKLITDSSVSTLGAQNLLLLSSSCLLLTVLSSHTLLKAKFQKIMTEI